MSQNFLEIAVPQCSAEDFDGEIVAINLDTGRYFSIRDAAAAVWHDLAAGHAIETVLGAVSGNADLLAATTKYIADLQAEGLMRPLAEPAASTAALETTAAIQPPVLESFGDMESLLLLDPVHEVDENEGWPKPRDA